MSPRVRRLLADEREMEALAATSDRVDFHAEGTPPDTYVVMLNVAGLAGGRAAPVVVRRVHRCRVYLHSDYPRRPPLITWLTPIFHPNILPPARNGGVCLGAWSASESLADVIRRLMDLVGLRAFNTRDPLDREAADWLEERGLRPGLDLSALLTAPAPVAAGARETVR